MHTSCYSTRHIAVAKVSPVYEDLKVPYVSEYLHVYNRSRKQDEDAGASLV